MNYKQNPTRRKVFHDQIISSNTGLNNIKTFLIVVLLRIFLFLSFFLFFSFFFFGLFRATLAAHGSSQARGQIGAIAMAFGIQASSATYTTAHGNAGSLTH